MEISKVRLRPIIQLKECPFIDEHSQFVFARHPGDNFKFEAHNLATGVTTCGRCMAPFTDIKLMKLSPSGKRLAYFVKTAVGLAIFARDSDFVLYNPIVCKFHEPRFVDFYWIADNLILTIHQNGIQLYSLNDKFSQLADKIKAQIFSPDYLPRESLLCFSSPSGTVTVLKVVSTSLVPYMRLHQDLPSPTVSLLDLYETPYLCLFSQTLDLYKVIPNQPHPTPFLCLNTDSSALTLFDNLLISLTSSSLYVFDCHDPSPNPIVIPLPPSLSSFTLTFHHSNLILTPSTLFEMELDLSIYKSLPCHISRCSFLLRRCNHWKIFLDYFKEIINLEDLSLLQDLFQLIYTYNFAEYTHEDLLNVMISSFHQLPHYFYLLHIRWTRFQDSHGPVLLIKSLIQQNKVNTVDQYIRLLPESVHLSQVLIESFTFTVEGIEMLSKFTIHGPYSVYNQLKSNFFDFGLLRIFVKNRSKSYVRVNGVECPLSSHFRTFLDIVYNNCPMELD